MQVNINSKVEKIEIIRNGNHVGDVEFSLSDPALLNRLRTVSAKAKEIEASSKLGELTGVDESLDEAVRIDNEIRGLLDWAFSAPVSEVVFGDSFSFTTCDGVTAVEQFLDGIMPFIEECFKAETEQAKKRQEKYLAKYKGK